MAVARYQMPDGRIARYEVPDPEPQTGPVNIARMPGQIGRIAAKPKEGPTIGDAVGTVLNAPYDIGGAVTDYTHSPALGVAANIGSQVPFVGGGAAVGEAARPVLNWGARKLMQMAIKPSAAERKGGAFKEVADTMFKEGIPGTEGGMQKLKDIVRDTNTQVGDLIAPSDKTVRIGDAGLGMMDEYNKALHSGQWQQDVPAVVDAYKQLKTNPLVAGRAEIPVQLAHDLKKGYYQSLGDKSYGEVQSSSENAQKAIARALRQKTLEAVPEAREPLAREAAAMNALKVAEPGVTRAANKNPAGLAWLAENLLTGFGFLAERSEVVKSALAHALYKASKNSAGVGAGAGALIPPSGSEP